MGYHFLHLNTSVITIGTLRLGLEQYGTGPQKNE
jgi:hypothetical protein